MKFWMGVLMGIVILFALFWGYRIVINPHYKLMVPKFVTDTTQKRPSSEDVSVWKSQLLNTEEKIASTNKRIDDLLIFGGIILTLLLAINIGVFVNAEKEVNKHFKEHFESHKEKVMKYLSEVEETAGKIKSELELAERLRKQFEITQTPPQ